MTKQGIPAGAASMWRQIAATRASVREGLRIALGRGGAFGHKFEVRSDDIFLVSYPKSGNTWTRFLLGTAASGADGSVDFTNIERTVPDINLIGLAQLAQIPGPRYIKSHASFDPRYPKVIYIVRNPLDIVVSYFHHNRKMGALPLDASMDSFIPNFLSDPLPYGTWAQNTGSWLGAMEGNPQFLLLRYEDMLTDTPAALGQILRFCGLPVDESVIARTVEYCSSDRMRQLEKQQAKEWGPTKNSEKSISFVRAAKSGSWKEELSQSHVDMICERWHLSMGKLGYLP